MDTVRVGCVVLASGKGTRFGKNKLLTDLNGTPLLAYAVSAICGAMEQSSGRTSARCATAFTIEDTVLVTCYPEAAEIADRAGIRAVISENPLQSDSVRTGLRALLADRDNMLDGVLFVQGDQPLLSAETVCDVLNAFARQPGLPARAVWRDLATGVVTPGNPVVFPQRMFDALMQLSGDRGGSALLKNRKCLTVEVPNAWELRDVDTPADLQFVSGILSRRARTKDENRNTKMTILIRGAGDLATGIALRLYRAGLRVIMTETAYPTTVRRTVAFSEAVRNGETQVEGIRARLAGDVPEALSFTEKDLVAVLVDPDCACKDAIKPDALVDAVIAKKNIGTAITDAPVVIGVGPGFTVGKDCHAAVETMRGHSLGRVLYEGSPIRNTGIPGEIGGYTTERIIRTDTDGIFDPLLSIGDTVTTGETVAHVLTPEGLRVPVYAQIDGILRGLLAKDIPVTRGMKAGDVDPRCERAHCFTASDKALAVGGGVLEAVLHFIQVNQQP